MHDFRPSRKVYASLKERVQIFNVCSAKVKKGEEQHSASRSVDLVKRTRNDKLIEVWEQIDCFDSTKLLVARS